MTNVQLGLVIASIYIAAGFKEEQKPFATALGAVSLIVACIMFFVGA